MSSAGERPVGNADPTGGTPGVAAGAAEREGEDGDADALVVGAATSVANGAKGVAEVATCPARPPHAASASTTARAARRAYRPR